MFDRQPGWSPPPTPAPVPLAEPPRKRGPLWKRVAAGALIAALVGSCAAAIRWISVHPWVKDSIALDEARQPGFWIPESTAGLPVVQWSGDGRYLVVQHEMADGTPAVVAVDARHGTGRVIIGYHVRFVERDAPAAWVVPWDPDERPWVEDGFGDPLDSVPSRLLRWKLDDGSAPVPTDGRWAPIEGPAGTYALFTVDASKGAAPSSLAFGSTGESSVTTVPPSEIGCATFVPVGWSPSGRYFAVEGLRGGSAQAEDGRLLVVLDGHTGKKVAARVVPDDGTAPAAVWRPDADALVWLKATKAEPDDESPYSSARLTFACYGFEVPTSTVLPPDFDDSRVVSSDRIVVEVRREDASPVVSMALGQSKDGPLFVIGSAVYRLEGSALRKLGVLCSGCAPGWHPMGGLAWAEIDAGLTRRLVIRCSDERADRQTVIWRGAEER